jgi:hypothetical protein
MAKRRFWEIGPVALDSVGAKSNNEEDKERRAANEPPSVELDAWEDLFAALSKHQAEVASAPGSDRLRPIFTSSFEWMLGALAWLTRSSEFTQDNINAVLGAMNSLDGMCRVVAMSASKNVSDEYTEAIRNAMETGEVIRINEVKARILDMKDIDAATSIEYRMVKEGRPFRLQLNQGRPPEYAKEFRQLDKIEEQKRRTGEYHSREDNLITWEKEHGKISDEKKRTALLDAYRKRASRKGKERRRGRL